jgi:phosphomannomutase/phosphoglucomutase
MLPLVDADLLARVWIDYKTAVRNAFQSPAGMPIAVDCMHGCYSRYAVEILDKMGFRAAMLRDEPRGDFGGATPDPSADRNLVPLSAAIAAGRYAFGAALDGDGDRVRFVDEHGAPVDNGTILVLLARYVIESGRDGGRRKVIYDQKTRLAVVQALRAIGTEPVMAKSGHTFIRTRMLREGALMAGEKSGHFFWGGGAIYPVDSGDCGLFAVLALGAALRFFDQPLATLAATVPPSPFYTGDIRGLKYDGDRHALLAGIARKIDTRRYRVDTEDGVRIETPAAFAHLRASVTESDMLTASFDAASWSELEGVANELLRRLPAEAAALKRALAERIMGLKP